MKDATATSYEVGKSKLANDPVKDRVNQLAALERELEQRKIREAIRYYRPHPKQEAFHGALARVRVFSAGNQTGKTTAGVAEDVAWSLGYRPWLAANHPDYIVKKAGATQAWEPVRVPTIGIIIGQTNDTLRRVQLASLLGDPAKGTPGMLPMDEVAETRKNQVGIITWIKLKNGSEIHLMTYEQDPMVFEGWRVNWVHADEPPPRGIYIAVWRGLAAKLGSLWLTMTPIAEPWVFDELMSKPETAVIYATTADNVGYGMSEKGLRDWESALSEDEREARLLGRPIHLRGLVYKEFDKRVHGVKRDRIDTSGSDVEKWMHVDPHRQKRHRAVWVAKYRDGRYVVCGELDARQETNLISDFADDIRAYEKNVLKWRHDDVNRLIDPYAKEPGVTDTGASVKDEFQARGMYFNVGSKDRTSAIHLMHELLRHFPERGLYPNLYVMDDLNKTMFEFEHYIFDDGPRGQDLSGQVAKPKKVYDDSLEGIHRIVLATYVPDEAEEDDDYTPVARVVGGRRGY